MVAKTSAAPVDDEDIIELTDIIEQGTPPSSSGSSFDAQLNDLMKGDAANADFESGGDDDLDALLAEISASPADAPASAPAPEKPSVNPDETLEMPDMKEVEDFFGELKLPSQPPLAAPADKADKNLDDVLNQLVGGPQAVKAAPSAADELDHLLDGIAQAAPTTTGKPDEPPAGVTPQVESALPDADSPAPADELDDLLEEFQHTAAAPAPPKQEPDESTPPGDELDALFENAAPPKAAAAESVPLVDELDVMLEELAPQADAALPAPEPTETATAAELDALLDELAPHGEEPAGKSPSASVPAASEPPADDLDALFDAAAAEAETPAPRPPLTLEPAPGTAASTADAFDVLLADLSPQTEQAETAPHPALETPAAASETAAPDLDALLESIAPSAPADLDSLLENAEPDECACEETSTAETSFLPGGKPPMPPAPAMSPVGILLADIERNTASSPEAPLTAPPPQLPSRWDYFLLGSGAQAKPEDGADYELPPSLQKNLAHIFAELGNLRSEAQARAEERKSEAERDAALHEHLDKLAQRLGVLEQAGQDAAAPAGADALDGLTARASDLEERLNALEQAGGDAPAEADVLDALAMRTAELDGRVRALEGGADTGKNGPAESAALRETLSGLESRLEAAENEARALRAQLETAARPDESEEVQELKQALTDAGERMRSLEARLEQLEGEADAKVERAAAAAAARIIRDELMPLVEELQG